MVCIHYKYPPSGLQTEWSFVLAASVNTEPIGPSILLELASVLGRATPHTPGLHSIN